MKKYMVLALCTALFMSISFPTHARPPEGAPSPEMRAAREKAAHDRFKAMDSNADGVVTAEEFKAFHPQMKDGVFAMIDSDKDKGLDLKEWQSFHEEHRRGMGAGSSGQGGMGSGSQHAPEGNNTKSDMLITPPAQ